ncbi:hypothetical protein [Bacillus andreraoultii]|uniref:hypothetical protein n=1 Tax=Bacillus andreraoultii TaxID=1499685 RepID=UPI000ACF982D|nr:hypothetical protein [Bacillus andreraoultii]
MPRKTNNNQRELLIKRLNEAGMKVHSGKKVPKKGEYSGIIGKSKKVLELKI